jgi:hypothetical protein
LREINPEVKVTKLKTIAFITPKIDTFSNPTLVYLFEKMIEKEYKILFFGYEQIFIPSEIRNKITFCHLPFNFYEFKPGLRSIKKLLKQVYNVYDTFKRKNKADKIICVDPMGLVIAGRINRIVKLPLIYFSFEIFFEDEFYVQRKKIIKKHEMNYSGGVNLVIVQDSKREKLLRAVNNFSQDTIFEHIPVSPEPTDDYAKNYDIYKELNIPKDKILIVYSGTLMAWSGISELLDLFPDKIPDKYWLIIHSHHKLTDGDELKLKMEALIEKKYNITFHNKPFYENKDYYSFLHACHIGLATYFPNNIDVFAGKNIKEIGLSSGKFSTYMMLGLPTITTTHSIYIKLNRKYGFGEIISVTGDIPEALERISDDIEGKRKNCYELYERELNPVIRFTKLLNYLDN